MLRAVVISAAITVSAFAQVERPAISEVKFVRDTREQKAALKLSGTALQQDQQWLDFVTSSLEYLNEPPRLTMDGTILDVAYKDQKALIMYSTSQDKQLRAAGLKRNNVVTFWNLSPEDVLPIKKGDRVRIEVEANFANTTDGTSPRGSTLYFVDFSGRTVGQQFKGRYIIQELIMKVRGKEFVSKYGDWNQ